MEPDPLRISPFSAKDMLVAHARDVLGPDATLLDASRGGPNWQLRSVQCAWHVLGLYADYCYGGPNDLPTVRVLAPDPPTDHAAHFRRFADSVRDLRESLCLGMEYIERVWDYLHVEVFPDRWIGESIGAFALAMTAGYYPSPATLDFLPTIASRFLGKTFGLQPAPEDFDLFLGQGATGTFGAVVACMARNELLKPGDKVAMVGPWYEPMRDLFENQYGCEVIPIQRHREHLWEADQSALEALDDPELRLLVIVSPGNPVDTTLDEGLLTRIEQAVERNPDLVILCDYVYANFVETGYDNILRRAWPNVVPFYAPSKDLGLVGGRLGVAWIPTASPLNRRLLNLPAARAKKVDARYASRSPQRRPSFYDRLVMDGSHVSFSHMAGLPTPSQVLLALCMLFPLAAPDEAGHYFRWVRTELRGRMEALYDGLGMERESCTDVCRSNYCTLLPLDEVAANQGPRCAEAFARVPLWSFLEHLAHSRGTIIMPGPAFGGEAKSARICLTSLNKSAYRQVGRNIAEAVGDYTFPTPCQHCR